MTGLHSLKLALTGFLLVAACAVRLAWSSEVPGVDSATTVSVAHLPVEGARTYALIGVGGPFPYDKDGTVFGNRERSLPIKTRGFYREYTVRTVGARDRGARRIVCGGEPRKPETCYYTADHYASFRRIVP